MTVVSLGAWCDCEDEHRDDGGLSFRVHEFAVLADGRRITLSHDLDGPSGFSSSTHGVGQPDPLDPWAFVTLEGLEASVRTTVLPDEDDTQDEHPWEWLGQRLQANGIDASPEQLEELPYDVVFSERLRARVTAHTVGDGP